MNTQQERPVPLGRHHLPGACHPEGAIRISVESRAEEPLQTIENFTRPVQHGKEKREAVEMGWEQEMGKTMFNIVNAYTQAAQFEGLPAEASYRLQKVGGMTLRMVK